MDKQPSLSERLGPAFWISLAWLLLIAGLAVIAGYLPLPEYDHMNWNNPASPPGTTGSIPVVNNRGETFKSQFVFLFGTDTMGRDIFTRLIFGARVSLSVGLGAPIIGMIIGTLLGLIAGFYQGVTESIIVAVMDSILAFPGLVLLLAITFILGPSLNTIIASLGFLTIPSFTRIARANTLQYAGREFVQAARMSGRRDTGIMVFEILPNIIIHILVYTLLVVSYMIVAEGALSFLGLSVPAPTPSWGGMIAEGKEVLEEAPHISMIPSLILCATVLSFNLIGDALRSIVDNRKGQL